MRRKRMESKIAQFSYDHKNFSSQIQKLRKSTGELSKMLDNLPKKGKEEKENKKVKKV